MIDPELLVDIIEETQQLSRIISSSIKTASKQEAFPVPSNNK